MIPNLVKLLAIWNHPCQRLALDTGTVPFGNRSQGGRDSGAFCHPLLSDENDARRHLKRGVQCVNDALRSGAFHGHLVHSVGPGHLGV